MSANDSVNEEDDLNDITDPRDSDVLCGRGGAALRHAGNQTYRRLVNLNKSLYITCLKTEKLKISRSIVAAIREQNGRFLERDQKKGVWFDIGDKKAIEKTSQALREGQPKLRKKMVEMGQIPGDHVVGGMDNISSSSMQRQSLDRFSNGIYNPRTVQSTSLNNYMNGNMGGVNGGMNLNMDMNSGMEMNMGLNMNMNMGMNMNMNGGNINMNMSNGQNMSNRMSNLGRDGSGNFQSSRLFESMQQQQQNYIMNMANNHMGRNNTGRLRNNLGEMRNASENVSSRDNDGDNDLSMLRNLSLDSTPKSIPSWTPSVGSGDSFMGMSVGTDVPEMISSRNRMRSLNRKISPVPYPNQANNPDSAGVNGHSDARDGFQSLEPNFIRDKIGSFEFSDQMARQQRQPQSSMSRDDCEFGDKNNNKNNTSSRRPGPTVNERRRVFARMKLARSGSGRSITDGMPDIHMVDSQFSLLSNLSAHGSKHNGQHAVDMAISTHRGAKKDSMGSEYIGIGSRRSLMSGLSKSTHSDDVYNTFYTDLSKKVGGMTNHTLSSRSLAMSEFSGVGEGEDEFAEDDFNFDIPTKR